MVALTEEELASLPSPRTSKNKDYQREYMRFWRAKNQEKNIVISRRHYQKNKDKINEKRRLKRLIDPTFREKTRARAKEWYEENRDRVLNYNYKRVGTQNKKRTGFCEMCDDVSRAVHHLIPRWFMKDNSEDNLFEVCQSHHIRLENDFRNFILKGEFLNRGIKNIVVVT